MSVLKIIYFSMDMNPLALNVKMSKLQARSDHYETGLTVGPFPHVYKALLFIKFLIYFSKYKQIEKLMIFY